VCGGLTRPDTIAIENHSQLASRSPLPDFPDLHTKHVFLDFPLDPVFLICPGFPDFPLDQTFPVSLI